MYIYIYKYMCIYIYTHIYRYIHIDICFSLYIFRSHFGSLLLAIYLKSLQITILRNYWKNSLFQLHTQI